MATLIWGWIKPLLEAVLPFWFKRIDNKTTTIENGTTPTKVADINERDYAEWLRKQHESGNIQQ